MIRKNKLPISLVLFYMFYFLSGNNIIAQQKFNVGLVAGLNFAELEGDGITDYFGLNGGLMGTAKLNDNWQLGMEFLFSQNGEYVLPDFYPNIRYGDIWLNHLEVPFYISRLMRVLKKDKYADWQLSTGVAYVKLLNFHLEDETGIDVSDQIIYGNETSFHFQTSITYFFSKNIGLNLKASFPLRKDALDGTLAARIVYMM